MGRKVVAAGHICIDITPIFSDKKVARPEEVLSPGKLIQVGKADIHTGGAVANTGISMSMLGADVQLMGKVGNDEFGKMILSILKERGMESGMIVSESSSTSYSVVLSLPGIDRIFLHHPGANNDFCEKDLKKELIRDADLFHFGYPPLMEAMYRNGGEELCKIYREVTQMGVMTSLDMASIDEGSEAAQVNWTEILRKVLPYVDFFFPSIEELAYMLDLRKYHELQEKAWGGDVTDIIDFEKDVAPLAGRLIDLGCKVALVKCGAAGLYYKTAGENAFIELREKSGIPFKGWANREGKEASYVPDRVLSGTGAGDTTIGAFLCAMLEERGLDDCLHLAAATGASCVEAYDALSGLKPFSELEDKIQKGWKKQNAC